MKNLCHSHMNKASKPKRGTHRSQFHVKKKEEKDSSKEYKSEIMQKKRSSDARTIERKLCRVTTDMAARQTQSFRPKSIEI